MTRRRISVTHSNTRSMRTGGHASSSRLQKEKCAQRVSCWKVSSPRRSAAPRGLKRHVALRWSTRPVRRVSSKTNWRPYDAGQIISPRSESSLWESWRELRKLTAVIRSAVSRRLARPCKRYRGWRKRFVSATPSFITRTKTDEVPAWAVGRGQTWRRSKTEATWTRPFSQATRVRRRSPDLRALRSPPRSGTNAARESARRKAFASASRAARRGFRKCGSKWSARRCAVASTNYAPKLFAWKPKTSN
mmetsp:Transcript_92909/g.262384  ORF Transcript_92909/g.262384 Transcript_92909/m.262384 type:complete len:248 (+) Transcript_92909:767-1510(+)